MFCRDCGIGRWNDHRGDGGLDPLVGPSVNELEHFPSAPIPCRSIQTRADGQTMFENIAIAFDGATFGSLG